MNLTSPVSRFDLLGVIKALRLFCLAAIMVLMVSCSIFPDRDISKDSEMTENDFVVYSNTQMTYQDLKIGVGNIRNDECTNEQGESQACLTAGLWIFFRDNSALDQQVRVHAGQTLTIGQYQILVTEIDHDDRGSFVKMQISK